MTRVVEGICKNGRIELLQEPPVKDGPVLVTFLDRAAKRPTRQKAWFGMFRGAIETTEEDFKAAEWHPKDDEI